MCKMQESNGKVKDKILFYLKQFFFSFSWIFVILLIFDLVSKACAMKYLSSGTSVVFIPHLIKFTLTYNDGAAWGMGGDATWSRVLLIIISWAAMFGIIYYYVKNYKKSSKFLKAILMVILAGDVGNLIDRTFYYSRGVVDFIDISDFFPQFNAIFNVADCCLVVGIILLLVYFLILWIKELKTEAKKNREEDNKDNSEK